MQGNRDVVRECRSGAICETLAQYVSCRRITPSLTDPSGLCFLGCFWKQGWFGPVLDLALFFVGLPELEVLAEWTAAGTGLFGAFLGLSPGLLVLNAGIAGGISGFASTGKLSGALLAAAQGVVTAGITPGIGASLGTALGNATVGAVLAQGLTGGLFSVASGGNFGSGFLAGGVGALAGPIFGGGPFDPGKMIGSAVLGGFASVLGGGKFANGALTGAFAYAAASYDEDNATQAYGQYADNSGTCDVPNCGNGRIESVTVWGIRPPSPFNATTYAFIFDFALNIGPIHGRFFGGVGFDRKGNRGWLYGYGGGMAGGLGGLSITGGPAFEWSNATTVMDMSGLFADQSVCGGAGPAACGSIFEGRDSAGRLVVGDSLTLGLGGGASISTAVTNTTVNMDMTQAGGGGW